MDSLINFFALRPTFSVGALKAVWLVYLLNALIQGYFSVATFTQAMAQRQIGWDVAWPSAIPIVFSIVSQVLLVRLLIEVAAFVISSHSSTNSR